MNNSPLNASSDFPIEQTELENHQIFIKNPLLASICAAICVFSSVTALLISIRVRLIMFIFKPETWRLIENGYFEISRYIDRITFINLILLSVAAFAGYLFLGSLNKWIGLIPLIIAVFFGLLYLLEGLQAFIGISFLPDFYTLSVFRNTMVFDIPLIFCLFLLLFIIPIIYLIGSIKAKNIPSWKWSVLIVIPLISIIIGLLPALILSVDYRGSFFVWLSWGMSIWIFFAFVIFSELIRTKVNKLYLWLTLILSIGAILLSILTFSVFTFKMYEIENRPKNRTSIEIVQIFRRI